MSNISASKKQALEIAKARLASMTDEEDAALVAKAKSDVDNPEWSEARLQKTLRGRPKLPEAERAKPVTIKLDPRVIAYFKGDNPKGWQTRVNEVLKKAAGL